MSETAHGYINTRMLCVHCIDQARSNENFPLKEEEVLTRHRCAVCGRTLRKALKDGPLPEKKPKAKGKAKDDSWVDLGDDGD